MHAFEQDLVWVLLTREMRHASDEPRGRLRHSRIASRALNPIAGDSHALTSKLREVLMSSHVYSNCYFDRLNLDVYFSRRFLFAF